MRLLIDTQIVQHLALRPQKLSRGERRILEDPRNSFVISAVSLWEMRIKYQTIYRSGDRKGEAEPGQVIETLDRAQFVYEPLLLTFEHCVAVLRSPLENTDQVDRLLLTQAQCEGLKLMTRDGRFEGHPLALLT